MTDRELDVLSVFNRTGWRERGLSGAAEVCRLLNLDSPCDWCPVGSPKDGERCATVPADSRERVRRVLYSLLRKRLLVRRWCGRDNYLYLLPEVSKGMGDFFPLAPIGRPES